MEAKAHEQSMIKVRAGQCREVAATALYVLKSPRSGWAGKKLKLNCRFHGVLRLEKRRGRVKQELCSEIVALRLQLHTLVLAGRYLHLQEWLQSFAGLRDAQGAFVSQRTAEYRVPLAFPYKSEVRAREHARFLQCCTPSLSSQGRDPQPQLRMEAGSTHFQTDRMLPGIRPTNFATFDRFGKDGFWKNTSRLAYTSCRRRDK